MSYGGWGVVDVGDVDEKEEGTEDCTLRDTGFGSERGGEGSRDLDLYLSVVEEA